MWQPLTEANQLVQNGQLRKVIHEGNFLHETKCIIIAIGNYYFMVEITHQNDVVLEEAQRLRIPYVTQNIPYHGFEIWQ